MSHTYILKCIDNRYYVGSTTNINQRLKEHLCGKCKFTKSRLPVEIIYLEEFPSYSDARKREYQIKGYKSRSVIEKLVKSQSMASSSNG